MAATNIVLGILILGICVAWYAWVSDKLRPQQARHDFAGARLTAAAMPPTGTEEVSSALSDGQGSSITEPPPGRDWKAGNLMGDSSTEEARYVISKDYRIRYSRQVYVNTPFELSVVFAEPGTLKKSDPKLTVRDGRVLFQTSEPEPAVRVELSFAAGAFEANETVQERPLKKRGSTTFSFWLKPLRSEDCLLMVSISCAAHEQVPEQLEQIRISTVQQDLGQQRTTSTLVKSPKRTRRIYRRLDRVTLNVSAVGFLGLSAKEMDFLSKSLGAMIAVLLVTISFITGRNFDWLQAIEFLILGVGTPLGITFYDGLRGTLKAPRPEETS
jgi:hypothetical protein